MGLEIVIWDVQHGSAAFIQTPTGTKIVKDLGTGSFGKSDKQFSPLKHLKEKYKIDQLDYVIISHPHKDHIDDILNFDSLSPRVLCRPVHLSREDIMKSVRDQDKPLFEKYFEIQARYKQPVAEENDPTRPGNNGEVEILSFHPKKCSTSNINNHSIVTVISYAGNKIMIPGDNESPSWKELLEDKSFREAINGTDILVASHHGREAGFCADLFDVIEPRLTIVSDDYESDSSAVSRYSKISTGWKVHHRSGADSDERCCVTTRRDGYIEVEMEIETNKKRYIQVTVA